MTTRAAKLLEDALQLPDTDRADLAAHLIDSLDNLVDSDAPAAWRAELSRRLAELDGGTVSTVPWPEARKCILGGPDGKSPC